MSEKRFCRVPTYTRLTRYQVSLMQTRALRLSCAPIFRPLFDHMVSLAGSSYAAFQAFDLSYLARRAGRELAQARKVAGYVVCGTCGQPVVDGTSRCSANAAHDIIGAATARELALVFPDDLQGAAACKD